MGRGSVSVSEMKQFTGTRTRHPLDNGHVQSARLQDATNSKQLGASRRDDAGCSYDYCSNLLTLIIVVYGRKTNNIVVHGCKLLN